MVEKIVFTFKQPPKEFQVFFNPAPRVLQDGAFDIIKRNGVSAHQEALGNPVWGIWLGRKCCIPASLICRGIFEKRAEAIADLASVSGARAVRVVGVGGEGAGGEKVGSGDTAPGENEGLTFALLFCII